MTATGLVRNVTEGTSLSDAEFLLSHLLGRRRHEMYSDAEPVPDPVSARFKELAGQVASGLPPQYAVCSAPFLDFDLYVDARVLIPRPETEELVVRAADRLRRFRVQSPISNVLVVDYGTGSGCIAIALARMFPAARVLAIDVSPDALEVCRRNVAAFGLSGRIALVLASSLTDPAFAPFQDLVDLLVSNPPYIPTGRIPGLEPRVRDHEPRLSLDGGPKGTNILEMLIEQGPVMLRPGGLLAAEIDSGQSDRLRRIAPAATFEPDFASRDRYLFLEKECTCASA